VRAESEIHRRTSLQRSMPRAQRSNEVEEARFLRLVRFIHRLNGRRPFDDFRYLTRTALCRGKAFQCCYSEQGAD